MKPVMCGRTDVGAVRQLNEDAFWCDAELGAAIVADGLGGHAAGEVASGVTIEVFEEVVRRRLGPGADLGQAKAMVAEALGGANQRVLDLIAADGGKAGMGSTAVCLAVVGEVCVIGHVGDSRVYLLRGGQALQLTKDHSFVQSLVDSGALSPEEARSHPQRNLITRCIGGDAEVEVDVTAFDIEPCDTVLLCSDGLCGVVDDEAMKGLIEQASSLDQACERLIAAALDKGAPDNVTAVLVGFGEAAGADLTLLAAELVRPQTWREGRIGPVAGGLWKGLGLVGRRWVGAGRRALVRWGGLAWRKVQQWRQSLPF